MIPASSLLAFELLYWAIDESLTSVPNLLFFSAWEKNEFIFIQLLTHLWVVTDFWLVGICRNKVKQGMNQQFNV